MSSARVVAEGSILRVSGDLVMDTVPAAWAQGSELLAGQAQAEVDLAGVVHSDSSALAMLVDWAGQAKQHGARVRFSNIPEQLLAIAHLSAVDHVLQVSESKEV